VKTIKVLLTIFVLLISIGCRQGYKIDGDNVYYEYWNEAVGQGKRLVTADANSFQKIKFDCSCSFDFGKDKKHLFIDGDSIKNIDPNTFRFIGNYMFADKDSAYFFGFYNNLNTCAVKGIDLKKLKLLKYPWSKAGNVLIHGSDTLTLKGDINQFVPIDEDWGKTRSMVINKSQILVGADPETFKVINSYSGKDKYHVYEFGKIK